MAALGVINVGFYTVLNAVYILWYLGYSYTWQYHTFNILTELLALSNPYLLLLFSTKLRKCFVHMIVFGHKKVSAIEVNIFH